MRKIVISVLALLMSFGLAGCSNTEDNTVQTRSDLTADHFRGLTSGMKRDDITGLIGNHDAALSDKEEIHVYSLSDGTTAVLRYQDDVLQSAAIRGTDNMEDTIFNSLDRNYKGGSFTGGTGGTQNGTTDATGTDGAGDGTADDAGDIQGTEGMGNTGDVGNDGSGSTTGGTQGGMGDTDGNGTGSAIGTDGVGSNMGGSGASTGTDGGNTGGDGTGMGAGSGSNSDGSYNTEDGVVSDTENQSN